MSKPETPCLPGCKKTFSQSSNGGMTIGTDHAANCQNASDSDRKCPACGGGEPGTLCRVQAPKAEAPQERRIAEGRLNKALTSALNGLAEYDPRDDNHWAKTAVAFARGCVRLGDVGAMRRGLKAEAPPAPKSAACCRAMESHICMKPAPPAPAEPPKCISWCRGDDHDHYCAKRIGRCRRACSICRALSLEPTPPPAPVSEPPIDFEQALNLSKTYAHETWSWAGNIARAHLALNAEHLALKARLDTDREVLKETENNISNLAKFAASPITPNYNLPMSGLAIPIRDSLAAALGREILLTQEWDALKAQNAALEAERDNLRMLLAGSDYARVVAELERLRDLIVRLGATEDALSSYLDRDESDEGEPGVEADLAEEEQIALDAVRAESKALRAAREGKK